MSCDEIYELISLHIDGETTPEQEQMLAAHLAECERCRDLLRAYEDIQSGVAELASDPPERFAEGVMYRVAQEAGGNGGKKRRFAFGHATAFAAVAAALVILVGTGLVKLPNSTDKAEDAACDTAAYAADGAKNAIDDAEESGAEEREAPESAAEDRTEFFAAASYDALFDTVGESKYEPPEQNETPGDGAASDSDSAYDVPMESERAESAKVQEPAYCATISGCKPEDIPELAGLAQDETDPNLYRGTAAQVREIVAAYRERYATDETDAADVPDDAPAELTILPE